MCGFIKCLVGNVDQLRGTDALCRTRLANADRHLASRGKVIGLNCRTKAFQRHASTRFVGAHQNQEFLAAKSKLAIIKTKRILYHTGKTQQHLVAEQMPASIVNTLKVINVEHGQPQFVAKLFGSAAAVL